MKPLAVIVGNAMEDSGTILRREAERMKRVAVERFGASPEDIDAEVNRIVKDATRPKNGNGQA